MSIADAYVALEELRQWTEDLENVKAPECWDNMMKALDTTKATLLEITEIKTEGGNAYACLIDARNLARRAIGQRP